MIRSRGVAVAKQGIARTRGGAADRATEAAAATQLAAVARRANFALALASLARAYCT